MSYNTLVNNILITPKSLKEVKSTGLKDLKALCKDAGINIGGVGREALEILLCIELGIRTSGVDVGDDFGRKIPKCVQPGSHRLNRSINPLDVNIAALRADNLDSTHRWRFITT